jgi:hypothetical protein
MHRKDSPVSTTPEQPGHPIVRALELARCTRDAFGLFDPVNLHWLMTRWNVRADIGLNPETLALVVQLALHGDRDRNPITTAEARDIAQSACDDFSTLTEARTNALRYAELRGADAAQRQRLDLLVRDTWNTRHAEVPHAA